MNKEEQRLPFEEENQIGSDTVAEEAGEEAKKHTVRRRKPYNYALERDADCDYRLKEDDADLKTTPGLWKQVRDGFVSPAQALEFVAKEKLQGVFRVVRVASRLYAGVLETPAPVFKMTSIGKKRGDKQ